MCQFLIFKIWRTLCNSVNNLSDCNVLASFNTSALCSLHKIKTVSLVGPRGEMDHVGYLIIILLMHKLW